jgi:phosphate transport system substrate-binding protein
MKETIVRRTLAILSCAGVVAATLITAVPAQANQTVPGGGASFPSVFLQDCATRFNGSQSNFTINYQSVGSGRGKSGFSNGTYVFGATDSAYGARDTAPSFGWTYVPTIGGAITLPINLAGRDGKQIGSLIQLRQSTIVKIFGGNITMWDHPEIVKANAAIAKNLPATPITVVYRADGSGTTNNFLQHLNAWNPTIFPTIQDAMDTAFPGKRPPSNSVSAPQNSGVMSAISATNGALGYVDLGDALKAGAQMARVQNALGQFVSPTSQSAAKNLANQTDVNAEGLVNLNYKVQATGAYPIAIFSYMLARTDSKGPNGLGVRQFARYALEKCGPEQAANLGFVPVAGKVLKAAVTLANKIA